MKLVHVKPRKRMDGIIFNPQLEYDHQVNVGNYRCPYCSEKTPFTTTHFDEAFKNQQTSLQKKHAVAFDRFRPIRTAKWESFLDFYCPGCKNPVRIIFRTKGEQGMKGYSFEVSEIVEAKE